MADNIITVDIPELIKKGIIPSDATASTDDVVLGKTFYSGDTKIKTGTLDLSKYELILPEQEKEITPEIFEQHITPDDGYKLTKVIVKEVTSTIDENIKPQNIKAGVSILGVLGNVEPDKPDQTKTVEPTEERQSVVADIGFELGEVIINPISNTYVGSGVERVEEKTITPTEEIQVVIEADKYTTGNILVDSIKTENVDVKSTEILQTISASEGKYIKNINVNPITLESKTVKSTKTAQTILPEETDYFKEIIVNPIILETVTVTPSTSQQEITSSADKDGIEKVIVEAVTSSIDENIIPDNIKQGVSILGVTGNMVGGITDLDYIKYHDNMIQIETGRIPPTDTEYEEIINNGYNILDYVFGG